VAPVANSATKHNEAALGHAKLTQNSMFALSTTLQVIEHRCRLTKMQLSADQIVEETSDWPEDAVADLVDRILRAKYGEVDPSVDKAWQDDTRRRIADMESGRVRGVPLEETLPKARKITGQ
jgi:putative addiction module component